MNCSSMIKGSVKTEKTASMPLISVIVPIYNIERYIGVCVESLIRQQYENLEIILVDDGSPDRCPEICNLYATKDDRIKVVHKENGGLVSARKAGLQASHGEYVGYVDGDDWVGPAFYETLVSAAMDTDSDVVIAGQDRVFFDQSKKLCNRLPAGVYEEERLSHLYENMLSTDQFHCLGVFTYLWNKLFRREALYSSQMNVDDRIFIGEDAACAYPALLSSKRVCIVEDTSYHYRQREDSMLKKSAPFSEELPFIQILHDNMLQAMCPEDCPDKYGLKQQIDDYILSLLVIRSGGLLPRRDAFAEVFPFGVNIEGKRVAIYSAGTFGQQLRKRLVEAEHCEVVGWFDYDYWEYRRCCLDVDPVEDIARVNADYILIASVNGELALGVKHKLIKLGVEEDKIRMIQTMPEDRARALNIYLHDAAINEQ